MNAPISAQTGFGSASFRRDSPTDVRITVGYRAPERRIAIEGNDLASAVAVLCEAEIDHTRKALTDVGEALAGQLSDVGTRPRLRREYEDEDDRAFSRSRDNVLTIAASRYESEEVLSHSEGVSDAALVRETVRQMIEQQRIRGIRKLHRSVLVRLQQAPMN